MFDDLSDETGFSPERIERPPQAPQQNYQQNQQQGSYRPQGQQESGNRSYGGGNGGGNGGGGGWSGGGGNNGQKFQRKEEVLEDPYIPVAIFVDKDFPQEVKDDLYALASKLISKKITVRIAAGDKPFVERVMALSSKFVELYLPWKNFDELNSRHTWNTITSKDIAQKNFLGWDKIPDGVKAILASNVRLLFGDKNNSVCLCLLTWSKDAATRPAEVTKDTGRSGFIIKMAASYGFPVLNVAKGNAQAMLEKAYGI